MKTIPTLLESQRTILKSPSAEYSPLLQQAIVESIQELRVWLSWAQKTPTLEECKENALKAGKAFNEQTDLQYYIFAKKDQTLLGCAGLHRIDWSVPKLEIGYWIRTSHQGQGYATEVCQQLAQMTFTQLDSNRVEIRCDDNNVRSKAVAQKAGFTFEGVLRNDSLTPNGELRNTAVFSRIKGD